MKKSTVYLLAAVLVFLAAVIWSAVMIVDFIYDATPMPLRFLRVICAGIWWIAFFVNLYRWRKIREEDR